MAYSTKTPPAPLCASISGQNPTLWMLKGTDPASTVQVSGFISNGGDLSMKVDDVVIYQDTNLNVTSIMNVISVSSTSPGAVDLQDAATIGSTTNSD